VPKVLLFFAPLYGDGSVLLCSKNIMANAPSNFFLLAFLFFLYQLPFPQTSTIISPYPSPILNDRAPFPSSIHINGKANLFFPSFILGSQELMWPPGSSLDPEHMNL